MGRFLMMAAIGCLVAMIVNFFLESAMFHFILSIVVVLVFAGLTAYETRISSLPTTKDRRYSKP